MQSVNIVNGGIAPQAPRRFTQRQVHVPANKFSCIPKKVAINKVVTKVTSNNIFFLVFIMLILSNPLVVFNTQKDRLQDKSNFD